MSVSNIAAYKKLEARSKITNLILRYLLYIILALFAFYFANQITEAEEDKILIPIILLMFPILDLFSVVLVRFYNNNLSFFKKIINVFISDRNHIHHIVLRKLDEEKKVVLLICIISFITSIVSIFSSLYLSNLNYGVIISLCCFLFFRKRSLSGRILLSPMHFDRCRLFL